MRTQHQLEAPRLLRKRGQPLRQRLAGACSGIRRLRHLLDQPQAQLLVVALRQAEEGASVVQAGRLSLTHASG